MRISHCACGVCSAHTSGGPHTAAHTRAPRTCSRFAPVRPRPSALCGPHAPPRIAGARIDTCVTPAPRRRGPAAHLHARICSPGAARHALRPQRQRQRGARRPLPSTGRQARRECERWRCLTSMVKAATSTHAGRHHARRPADARHGAYSRETQRLCRRSEQNRREQRPHDGSRHPTNSTHSSFPTNRSNSLCAPLHPAHCARCAPTCRARPRRLRRAAGRTSWCVSTRLPWCSVGWCRQPTRTRGVLCASM